MGLTELEGAILGIVASRQPCSAYVVRQRFEKSPTWGWSSSKGAIYPAVRRMIVRGLLTVIPLNRGEQRSDQLELSDSGQRALASWVLTYTESMGGAPIDPLRTRVSYLAALTIDERTEFLDRTERDVRRALNAATQSHPDPKARDSWALEASRLGVRMQIEAKLAWLQAIRGIVLTAADKEKAEAQVS